jgi:hypothetical protein
MKNIKRFTNVSLIISIFILTHCSKDAANDYSGNPFSDLTYNAGPQTIPGKVQCEYYDLGGEGIAYHDSDSTNSGSGGLNPADGSYLNEFRKDEGVDISYTKIDDREIDNNPYNLVEPEKNKLYVGWTEPGEWMNYTVHVQKAGVYKVGIMYTANRGGKISLSIDDQEMSGPVDIPTTHNGSDSLQWRQWHHWNYVDRITQVTLNKGEHILTLKTVAEGNMNYDYLNFELID